MHLNSHHLQSRINNRLVTGDAHRRHGYALTALLRAGSVLASTLVAVIALLAMPRMVLAQTQAASAGALSRDASNPTTPAIEQILASRGLLGGDSASRAPIAPPTGVEVDETVQRGKQDGKMISRTRSWTEELNHNALHVELTSFPGRQTQVAFWVFPDDSRGCLMFGRTMYGTDGHQLVSEFWRNDRELRITGAEDFPADLYPEAIPAVALLRVVDSMHPGSAGKIDQQVSPYGFVDQQVSVQGADEVEVPAGRFDAVRIDSQPNASTILPSWPRFTLGVVATFLPQTTYYFQAAPPHRLLRKEQVGTPFIGGPEAITELVHYYTAGETARNGVINPGNGKGFPG
jgi:hypothetical protein